MNAPEILARVRAKYRACSAYRDYGTTTVRGDLVATFTTEYRRDVDELRFRYEVTRDEWLELSGAKGRVESYRSSPPELASVPIVTSEPTLREIVGTIAGITFGASATVPPLLVPECLGETFQGECAILTRERVEGEPWVWIYFGGGHAIAVETKTSRLRRSAMFLSDVVTSDGRVRRSPIEPEAPLDTRAMTLTSYEVHELA